MNSKSNSPRRRNMRLRNYDYSQPGAYFVSICVQHRKCLFGTITDGKMRLNKIGQIVVEYWNRIPQHFPSVELGDSVIMPNHMHGIISWGISETMDPQLLVGARSPRPQGDANNRRGEVPSSGSTVKYRRGEVPSSGSTVKYRRGEVPSSSTNNRRGEVPSPSLGKIIAYFKYQSTKHINQLHNTPGTRIWQRNYHDHVIRDDPDLQRLRQYIQDNPMKWELDQLHPNNPSRW